jgi:hypothetical protein
VKASERLPLEFRRCEVGDAYIAGKQTLAVIDLKGIAVD